MPRSYTLRSIAEQKRILKEYDKAPRGWKWEVLEKHGIRGCHIYNWRAKMASMARRKK